MYSQNFGRVTTFMSAYKLNMLQFKIISSVYFQSTKKKGDSLDNLQFLHSNKGVLKLTNAAWKCTEQEEINEIWLLCNNIVLRKGSTNTPSTISYSGRLLSHSKGQWILGICTNNHSLMIIRGTHIENNELVNASLGKALWSKGQWILGICTNNHSLMIIRGTHIENNELVNASLGKALWSTTLHNNYFKE